MTSFGTVGLSSCCSLFRWKIAIKAALSTIFAQEHSIAVDHEDRADLPTLEFYMRICWKIAELLLCPFFSEFGRLGYHGHYCVECFETSNINGPCIKRREPTIHSRAFLLHHPMAVMYLLLELFVNCAQILGGGWEESCNLSGAMWLISGDTWKYN